MRRFRAQLMSAVLVTSVAAGLAVDRQFGWAAASIAALLILVTGSVLSPWVIRFLPGRRGEYLRRLRTQLTHLEIVGIAAPGDFGLPIQELYVDLKIRSLTRSSTETAYFGGQDLANKLWRDALSPQHSERSRVFVVLGGPGSGKTALLQYIALKLCNEDWRPEWLDRRPLPILLYLRKHASAFTHNHPPRLAELAAAESWIGGALTADWMERRLNHGRCLVLFDGLDEIGNMHDRNQIVAWIELQAKLYPKSAFMLTSRPVGYSSNPLSRAAVFQIEGLDDAQISAFVHNWYNAVSFRTSGGQRSEDRDKVPATDLLTSLRRFPDLHALAASPLLLTMIIGMHYYRGALPSSRAALYGEMCDVLLGRRQAAKGLFDDLGLTANSKAIVLRSLALEMMRERLNEIPYHYAESIIEIPLRRVGRESKVTAASFLKYVALRNGLLLERGHEVYAFATRGFQEYLAASQIREQPGQYLPLLTGGVDDPWWRETILLWAAEGDATPIIEACLHLGTDYARSLAMECLDVAREISPEVRHALSRLLTAPAPEMGIADLERVVSPSTSLINYVTRTYGEAGQDRAGLLLHLAEVMMGRRREAALDLYLAALNISNGRMEVGAGVDDALVRYLRALSSELPSGSSRELVSILKEEAVAHGHAFFDLLLPLLAESDQLRTAILDVVCEEPTLISLGIDYLGDSRALRTSWEEAIKQWKRERWWLVQGLREIEHLEISNEDLASCIDIVQGYERKAPAYLREELDSVEEILSGLRIFARSRGFDERENSLRSARRIISALQNDIRAAPTALAVEVVDPVVERLKELADRAYRQLIEKCPPQPGLSLALEQGRSAHDVVTVEVKVTNALDSAPVESAELLVAGDPNRFTPLAPRTELPEICGGASHIELVRLMPVDKNHSTSVELDLSLRYKPRFSEEIGLLNAPLKVPIPRPERFKRVPNPFLEGATGRPVQSQDMFFGRDELIKRVRARLREATSPGTGVAIFGQKRAGKSSIRLHLVRQLRELDGLPVVDIGNIGDLSPEANEVTGTRLIALLMWRILEEASEVLPKDPPLIPTYRDRASFLASEDPVYDCGTLFRRHREAIFGQRPLVVLMDEFQYLERWIDRGLVSPVFMQAFKALIEKRLFHIVIVGQSDIDRLIRDDPNTFGVFSTERVNYLEERYARKLVEVPIRLRSESRYKERAVDRILELTGGNAFYIQRFCYELVEYMNEERAPLVTEADVDSVLAEFLNRLEERDFDNLEPYGGENSQYQPILLAIARASRHGPATLESIARSYHGEALSDLLRVLVQDEVIRREAGAFRIAVGIYGDWLLRYFGAENTSESL